MSTDGYIVLAVIFIMIIALAKEVMRPGLILFSAVTILMASGIISSEESLSGFSNKGMITVAILFLVSEGVRQSGALNKLAQAFLPKRRGNVRLLFFRLMFPVSFLSAFLNNTPVVIIFAPMIKKWSERLNLSSQKFLIPLSYATIFGGICTLIGTSTNLVVHGLMLENGMEGISMFELGKVGIFIAISGFIYMSYIGVHLLPGKKDFIRHPRFNQKDYYYDLIVPEKSALVGHIIRNKRLRELKGLDVISVERDHEVVKTKNTEVEIQANDKLFVAGKSDSLDFILGLNSVRLKGLDLIKQHMPTSDLKQIEAVIAPRFPGVGRSIVEYNFFEHYHAAVLAIHRNGERITSNLANLKLKAGDNLVLLSNETFIKNWSDSKIFYLVSSLKDHEVKTKKWRRWAAIIILLLMIIGATVGKYIPKVGENSLDMFYFAAIAAILLVWFRIMPHQKYTKAISWDILITIACSFGISKAMQSSGAADAMAHTAINFAKNWGPVGVLACIYLITTIFTEIITNNAAAALVFPVALSASMQLGVDPKPFFIAICIAASASFSTPIGYQTNLIVQGVGNYKFRDFVKVGLPMNLISFIISMLLIPYFWKF